MSFNFQDFIKNSLSNQYPLRALEGENKFLGALEFYYFSNVVLKNKNTLDNSVKLVLEMNCNLNLLELLSHFNTGRWGSIGKEEAPILMALSELNVTNNQDVDIDELTLFLKDTNIVIKRIYQNSIATEFDNILKEIASNYVFLTRGLTKKPYEIFVPIFEDTLNNNSSSINIAPIENKMPKTYSEFWGIYLDSDDEASIFDLQTNAYINGDLEFYLSEED